jgi:hypothetical protein
MSSTEPSDSPRTSQFAAMSVGLAASVRTLVRLIMLPGRGQSVPPFSFVSDRFAHPSDAQIELQPLILEVLQRFEHTAALRLVQMQIELQEGLAAQVARARLDAALSEIVAGAIRRAPAGQIRVTTRRRDADVVIVVTDDGAAAQADLAMSLRLASNALGPGGCAVVADPRDRTGNTVSLQLPAAPHLKSRRWRWTRTRISDRDGDATG